MIINYYKTHYYFEVTQRDSDMGKRKFWQRVVDWFRQTFGNALTERDIADELAQVRSMAERGELGQAESARTEGNAFSAEERNEGTEENAEERNEEETAERSEENAEGNTQESTEAKTETEEERLERDNERYNSDLDAFSRGEGYFPVRVGTPSAVLRACGLNDTEMYIKRKVLRDHLNKHNLTVDDIRDLPKALQNPLLVYEWGETAKSMVIITNIEHGNDRITVAVKIERGGEIIEVNEIASVHAKEASRFLSDMARTEGEEEIRRKFRWVGDKEKALNWLGLTPSSPKEVGALTEQELSVAKVIQDFENPTLPGENSGTSKENGENSAFSAEERENAGNIGEKSVNLQGESGNAPKYRGWEKRSTEINTSDYEPTDEFRELQERNQSRGEEAIRASWTAERCDEQVGLALADVFKRQLDSSRGVNGVEDGILGVEGKPDTQFTIRKNVSGKLFHDIFEIARSYLPNGELVDLHDSYDDCVCYLSDDGTSGFAIERETGNLVSVFNLGLRKGFLYAINDYIKREGATHLDAYASKNQNLRAIYNKTLGAKVASSMDYNMEYDHDGIAERHGSPDVVFMLIPEKGKDISVEERHFGKDEYDEAEAYANSFNVEGGENSQFSDADTRETLSDIENPENDDRFSAAERVATADEARD